MEKRKFTFKTVLQILLYAVLLPFAASIPGALALVFLNWRVLAAFVPAAVIALLYLLLSAKLDLYLGAKVNGLCLFSLVVLYTVLLVIAKGEAAGKILENAFWIAFPFVPQFFFLIMPSGRVLFYLSAALTYLAAFVMCFVLEGRRIAWKRILFPGICMVLCLALCTGLYLNRASRRYAGHGFDYMHGWSSTDFTDYTVYSRNSKLASLDHPASFVIEDPDRMPIMDGAEACYPLYAAIAKAVYRDIDVIEREFLDSAGRDAEGAYLLRRNGRIVTFTNTIQGFEHLVNKDLKEPVDLFFGARPSKQQMDHAKEWGVSLEITPIGREGFVFFTEDDNPVDSLTSDQIRAIYHGDITNWKEVGGKDRPILAFQRPANSGSQTMMEYFMGDVSLKEPMTYETVNAMSVVIKNVAQYADEAGAFGYSFRYFVEELNQEKNVKLIAVDGVRPTLENIENGTYPLTVDLCLITDRDTENENVGKMIDFILSDDGQEIIRKTGYAGLH